MNKFFDPITGKIILCCVESIRKNSQNDRKFYFTRKEAEIVCCMINHM